MTKTRAELEQLIKEEDELIVKLNASFPAYDNTVDRYHVYNTGYHQHVFKLKDAYWRRRNWVELMIDTNFDISNNIY